MKIKLKQSRAGRTEDGNTFSQNAGDIVDMPEDEAKRYIEAGFGEVVSSEEPTTEDLKEQVATLQAQLAEAQAPADEGDGGGEGPIQTQTNSGERVENRGGEQVHDPEKPKRKRPSNKGATEGSPQPAAG